MHTSNPPADRRYARERSYRRHAASADTLVHTRRQEGRKEMHSREGALIYCKTG